jgi:hypothetical protein
MSEPFGGHKILTVSGRRLIFFLNEASNEFFITKFAADKKKWEKFAKKVKIWNFTQFPEAISAVTSQP